MRFQVRSARKKLAKIAYPPKSRVETSSLGKSSRQCRLVVGRKFYSNTYGEEKRDSSRYCLGSGGRWSSTEEDQR